MMTAREILDELNQSDERRRLEAKACASGKLGKSFFETVCAFANEPNMQGGHLLLGVTNDESDLFETNTAETKGSGIRVMRRLMREAGFSPPTFHSDREKNTFTSRFLLAHFLNTSDLAWLQSMSPGFTENQKIALIFLREQGAIDNTASRQLTDCDTLSASSELRKLRDSGFLEKMGGGARTYYVPGPKFLRASHSGAEVDTLDGEVDTLGGEVDTLGGQVDTFTGQSVPAELRSRLATLSKRPGDKVRPVILALCQWRALSSEELSRILFRNQKSLIREHLRPLVQEKKLRLKYEDMINHPAQAYLTTELGTSSLEPSDR